MTSINFNASATTALRTLQQTNSALETTQNRVSTGLKIGEAKDNAAYWAISTTLKSDNKSLATVKDALGLGAATVDTAYQGLNKAKEVLEEIKVKLTASTQAGVDRNVIQSEISELQKQLTSIASSSVFSGENWLSINSEASDYSATKKVVSSFIRGADNSVSIGTVDVNIDKVALFDSSTVTGKNGILDGLQALKDQSTGRDLDLGVANATGNTNAAGLTPTTSAGVVGGTGTPVTAAASGGTLGTAGTLSTVTYTAGNLTLGGTPAAGDILAVTVTNSAGGTQPYAVTISGATPTAQSVLDDIRAAITAGASNGYSVNPAAGGNLVFTSDVAGTQDFQITFGAVTGTPGTGTYGVAAQTPAAGTAATAAVVKSTALTVGEFAVGDKITLTLDNNGTPTTVTTGALVAASGTLALSDIASALNAVLGSNAVASIGTAGDLDKLILTSPTAGLKTAFSLTEFVLKDSAGTQKAVTGVPSATVASFETSSFSSVSLDANDNMYFSMQVGDATGTKNVTINQKVVDEALKNVAGHVSGNIASVAQFKTVVEAAMKAADISGITVAVTNTDKLTFSTTEVGSKAKLIVSDVKASAGGDEISVEKIDISDAALTAAGITSGDDIAKVLRAYVAVVNDAITTITTAAANLGAVSSRIDLQNSFVDTLMDTIDKGVSNLIDADLSEESTKLQALQTKQQLGIQALSIANSSQQNILRLFQ
jgi:flagellin-like hook-associated protein FlgL